jgi:hypothetical protein
MQRVPRMAWRVYTKRLVSANSTALRWFWCAQLPHGSVESLVGFSSRAQCEADALKHGCRPEDQQHERGIPMARLPTVDTSLHAGGTNELRIRVRA